MSVEGKTGTFEGVLGPVELRGLLGPLPFVCPTPSHQSDDGTHSSTVPVSDPLQWWYRGPVSQSLTERVLSTKSRKTGETYQRSWTLQGLGVQANRVVVSTSGPKRLSGV